MTVTAIKPAAKELSMTPNAVAKRARAKAKPKAIKVSAAQKRNLNQLFAALAAGFLPIASFVLAHYEVKTDPRLWVLVAAALVFSAPTLAAWAQRWCVHSYKAWGFTGLLEGVMVLSHIQALSFAGLAILVLINASNAWELATAKIRS
jgi:VIT1/CCC1 family predicted Fe2+/Mn2+ transporter